MLYSSKIANKIKVEATGWAPVRIFITITFIDDNQKELDYTLHHWGKNCAYIGLLPDI